MANLKRVAIPYSSGLRFSGEAGVMRHHNVGCVAIPYSSGLRFSDQTITFNGGNKITSQSLIHQVFDSQVRCLILILGLPAVAIPYSSGLRFSEKKCKKRKFLCNVAIPYSSGLRFSATIKTAMGRHQKSRNPLFIRSSILRYSTPHPDTRSPC